MENQALVRAARCRPLRQTGCPPLRSRRSLFFQTRSWDFDSMLVQWFNGAIGIHQPRTCAKINGATIVASDSMMNLGVFTPSFPQVIFSFGTAPL